MKTSITTPLPQIHNQSAADEARLAARIERRMRQHAPLKS